MDWKSLNEKKMICDFLRIKTNIPRILCFIVTLSLCVVLVVGGETSTKQKSYKVRSIDFLNPKILIFNIEDGYEFALKLDANIEVGLDCAEWKISPMDVFGDSIPYVNTNIICEGRGKYPIKGIRSVLLFKNRTWGDVKTEFGENILKLLWDKKDGMNTKPTQLIGFDNKIDMYLLKNGVYSFTVSFNLNAHCPYYRTTLDDYCQEQYFKTQWEGRVIQKIRLKKTDGTLEILKLN